MSVNIYPALRENLLAVVDYPPALTALIGEAAPWRDFCALPEEVKQKLHFPDAWYGGEVGYRRRRRKEGRDEKEYFHHTGKRFAEHVANPEVQKLTDEFPIVREFLAYCETVHREAAKFIEGIVRESERDIPGFRENVFPEGEITATLRLLNYLPGSAEEKVLADPHFDRGGFTLHLFETHPGLEYLDWDYAWKNVPIEHGKTVIFTGYQLSEFTGGKCQKTWHRVVQDKALGGRNRFSMVYFCELINQPLYPADARTQNEKPRYERV